MTPLRQRMLEETQIRNLSPETQRSYLGRISDECRQLARLTPGEDAPAADFARLAEQTEGWR